MAQWEGLIADKLRDRASKIPPEWVLPETIINQITQDANISAFDILRHHGLLSREEVAITESYDAQSLHQDIIEGRLTSLQVCKAFCKRAAIAQQLTNCATEILFAEAFKRAEFLDGYLAKYGRPYGPFHGLPISLKDSFNIKGQAATIGFVSFLGKPVAAENSPLVDILLANGAILYIKTNIPQTLLTMDSVNNIFGRTLNPHKLCLSAGGSSGGEGALVAFRGSILGVGTDVGGSIRAPSLCNGTYGFKPTADRIPHGGVELGDRPGTPGLVSAVGPLANSASDLTFFCKTILSSEPWRYDSTAFGTAWRHVPPKKKLSIGVYMGDEHFPLFPPVKRALSSARAALENAGHSVHLVANAPSFQDGLKLAARYFLFDTKQTLLQHVLDGNEQPIKALEYASPAALAGLQNSALTLDDVWDANASLMEYREKMAEVWKQHNLDVLICPGHWSTAGPHDTYGPPVYTVIWNLLNFPASVIPYLKADKSLDSEVCKNYDPDAVDGAPTAIQVVGWRLQDEEVLMATEVIDKALRSDLRYRPSL
ncbi:amidase [Aspergillus vadensis CBS 113365]|uniref:amidase n=1 Tax=Aspergillus vadensis (strain CBS 113365 / IMI 142717 / IBT 24658) TaxID=1448311 RepID=A0A319B962_ASPVC|nr:amidase [Aspergillus vadensis CBS 113365]PYH69247.1 amidase [Aspergillus vadensis CBS 113365]